jgi:hypothetical protein
MAASGPLRARLRDADAIIRSELHSFKELMADHAGVIGDNCTGKRSRNWKRRGISTNNPPEGTAATLAHDCRQMAACTCDL